MKGLKFKNKKAAAFGCYGWSGESVKILNEMLTDAGFDVVNDGLKCLWNPDDDVLKKAYDFGKEIA
jgi:flavorubredoxin